MNESGTVTMTASPPDKKRGFWQRRLLDPLLGFLAQGVTPGELSRAISLAVICGLFPFLGATTLLTLGVGLALRLNQPVMQTINYLLSGVQLLMIPVYVQLGAIVLGANADNFSVSLMLEALREGSFMDFLRQFGMAGWYAFIAWLISAPLIVAVSFITVSPMINRLAAKRAKQGSES
jgi:uncharacterized protein (DUF2062 family)